MGCSFVASSSAVVEDSRLEPDAQVFVEAHAQIALALWLEQEIERARLAFVVGAAQELRARRDGELRVRGEAVAERREARHRERGRVGGFRQAAIALRHA